MQVLRGRAAADIKSPMQAVLQDNASTPGRNTLCSPAKKFRAAAAADAHTPSRIQAGSPSPPYEIWRYLVYLEY